MPQPTRPQLAIYIAAAIAVLLIGARFLRSQDGAASGDGFGTPTTAAGAATNGAGGGGTGSAAGAGGLGSPDGALSGSAEGDPPLAADGQLVVDVKGAVRRPGVYRLTAGSRAMDAVRRAGGVTRQADRLGVNLAARVTDGGEVVVPRRAAGGGAGLTGGLGASGGGSTGSVAGAGTAGASGAVGAGAGSASGATGASATGEPERPLAIDINTATAQELELLDGVGPATAANIIAYRDANGGFSSIEELDEVSGIGEARLAAIRTQLGL